MPTYQYECDACGHSFEILQSMLDKKLKNCPACSKNTLHRLIGAGNGIIFKGSGFYETDYKKKESSNNGAGNGSSGSSAKSTKPKADKSTSPEKNSSKEEAGQTAK